MIRAEYLPRSPPTHPLRTVGSPENQRLTMLRVSTYLTQAKSQRRGQFEQPNA